jgi:hypothetical protein
MPGSEILLQKQQLKRQTSGFESDSPLFIVIKGDCKRSVNKFNHPIQN